MLKNSLQQRLSQRLSPAQIQLMNILALPVLAFEQYVSSEIEANPALEADYEGNIPTDQDTYTQDSDDAQREDSDDYSNDITIHSDDDISKYMYDDDPQDDYPSSGTTEGRSAFLAAQSEGNTFVEHLLEQLSLEHITEKQKTIGRYIIGNIDPDGYLRRDIMSISDDIAFSTGEDMSESDIKDVLKIIQTFDPSGVGATSLKECLLIQLRALPSSYTTELCIKVVDEDFEHLSKKNFDKIIQHLGCSKEALVAAVEEISRLNPRPGGAFSSSAALVEQTQITPDFTISIDGDNISISLNNAHVPTLKVSKEYTRMLTESTVENPSRAQKDTATFVKSKVDAARWFIDAVRQRQNTLMSIMRSIVRHQRSYIISADVADMRPLGLKDIAEDVKMDISTVSRVVSQKYADTPYGVMSLKEFFSEGSTTTQGEDISTREVKMALQQLVEDEDKTSPFTDDELTAKMKEKGYKLARRTVAKYREALGIATARMRRKV
ncbi:MAG: RNA polymerase factor sigma-54 [Flavobacteriales bacterium]|nr:RNA polymerase factor sigma-54 [Flavobacteriales bacterium]